MGRVLLSILVLTLFASPSLAGVCSRLQADFKDAEAAHEQAEIEFEAARLAYDQAQAAVRSARVKRDDLRLAFQTIRFDRKASSGQRVQARADWQQAVDDFRITLDDLKWAMDTLETAMNMRAQANGDFDSARLAYVQAESCHPLYWVKLVTTTAVEGAATVAGGALAVAYLSAYPFWMVWPFLAF